MCRSVSLGNAGLWPAPIPAEAGQAGQGCGSLGPPACSITPSPMCTVRLGLGWPWGLTRDETRTGEGGPLSRCPRASSLSAWPAESTQPQHPACWRVWPPGGAGPSQAGTRPALGQMAWWQMTLSGRKRAGEVTSPGGRYQRPGDPPWSQGILGSSSAGDQGLGAGILLQSGWWPPPVWQARHPGGSF